MAATAEPKELVLLSKAARALSAAKTFDEVVKIRDHAEAARVYVRAAKLGTDLYNEAAEVKLRAERKCGAFLPSSIKKGGNPKLRDATLEDYGIEKTQSHRWQRIASVDDESFESYISTTKDAGKELTTAAVLRLAKGEAPEPEPWTIGDVLRALTTAARRIFDKCPEQDRETMAHKLRGLGDEILETGGLRA